MAAEERKCEECGEPMKNVAWAEWLKPEYACPLAPAHARIAADAAEIAKRNEVIVGLVGHIRHHEECPSHPSKLPPPNCPCPCPCGASESLAAAAPFMPQTKDEKEK